MPETLYHVYRHPSNSYKATLWTAAPMPLEEAQEWVRQAAEMDAFQQMDENKLVFGPAIQQTTFTTVVSMGVRSPWAVFYYLEPVKEGQA